MKSLLSKSPRSIKNAIYRARGVVDRAVVVDRAFIAQRYLHGQGIEIGALHVPLRVGPDTWVRYVDRMSVDDLRRHYPELAALPLVPVDIIANGETLDPVADSSQDFCIANHFLEHCQNPIDALRNQIRVLKPGGVLFIALPDKRYTFDQDRPITPTEHIVRDFLDGPAATRLQAFEDWVRFVERAPDADVQMRIKALMEEDYSIHYHAWTQREMLEMFVALARHAHVAHDIELFLRNGSECIFVVRKPA